MKTLTSNSDKIFQMETAKLECAISNNLRTEDLKIGYNKATDTYAIINVLTKKVMFKKKFN